VKFAGENSHLLQTLPQMDLQKTKIYLDKLNREFARMSKDPDNIMRIDMDIMASYVRELYDSILSHEGVHVQKHEASTHRKHTSHAPVEQPVAVVPPPVVAAPTVVPPPPTVVPAPAPPVVEVAPPPQVQAEAPVPAPAPPPPVEEPKPAPVMAAVPKMQDSLPEGLDVLFEEKQAKELSEKLSELPIADLKKAIALNDRLLLTSELFAGDGKAFETAIGGINAMSSFDEAQAYLIEHCVVRYAWTDKKRVDTAKHFVKLVRRRFK
jgi:hypothetical protein